MSEVLLRKKEISLRINFGDVEAVKFEAVKKYLGLKQNTEVLRALVSEKYNSIRSIEEKQRQQRIREAEAMEWLKKGEYKCPM